MEESTKQIQSVVFDIVTHFDALCRENGLTYFLAYGSLLGGVRHRGFIPWDDDFDVWMPRAEYDRLQKITAQDPDGAYTLFSDPENGDPEQNFQGKFINRALWCDRDSFGHPFTVHPWIDIFILDEYPSKKEKRYLRGVKRASVLFNLCRLRHNENARSKSGGIHKILFKINDIFPVLDWIGEKRFERSFLRSLRRYRSGDRYFCFATVYMKNLDKCTFEKEWFGKMRSGAFEDVELPFPENADAILTKIYHDYMTPPPPEKRILAHQIRNIRETEEN